MAAPTTRDSILRAALDCFITDGFERTTTARIRERSGVSNGALFHHFKTKEDIADALFVDAMVSYQQGLWEIVRRKPRSLRAAVRAAIGHQLGWVEDHPDLARFVYMRGHLDWSTPAGAQVEALNRDLAGAFTGWMAPLVERGEIRPMSMLTVSAIVSGPAHAVARRWLAGHTEVKPREFTDELADAAWAGLRGRPVSARRRAPAGPRRGRVSLELVNSEGTVVAAGEATAELEPVANAG